MPISVTCTCGHRFRALDAAAGKDGTCPACNQPLKLNGSNVAPYDVFISYSSKDKTIADAAVAVLEQRGLRCWVAPRDIVAGKEWSESIIEGIEQSRLMVLIFSQNSNQSQQVVREVERAVAKGLPIIPFRIEDVPASKSMEYFISSRHWLDAFHPPLEQHLNKLADMAQHLLDGAPPPKSADDARGLAGKLSAATGTLLSRDKRTRMLLAAAGVVMLAALVIGASALALREPLAPQAVIALKAEAETVAAEASRYDPGEDFAHKQSEIQQALSEGASLFSNNQFQKAGSAYQRTIDAAHQLREAQSQRQSASAVRSSMLESRQLAESAQAQELAQPEWQAASQHDSEAQRLFAAGDFLAAGNEWQLASAGWKEAATRAKTAGQARMKALSFWLGYATKNASLFEQLRPPPGGGGLNVAPGRPGRLSLQGIPAAAAPADWPPYKATVDEGIRILESECRQNLSLEDELFGRFLGTTEQGVRDAIYAEMSKQLGARHGDQAEKAARLGVALALLRVACHRPAVGGAMRTGMTRAEAAGARGQAGITARSGRPNSLGEATDRGIERAYECGASQDLIDAIKNIRRTWDSLHDGFLVGEWGLDSAHQSIRDQSDQLLLKYFGSVETATTYFASARPAPPPAPVEPDPRVRPSPRPSADRRYRSPICGSEPRP